MCECLPPHFPPFYTYVHCHFGIGHMDNLKQIKENMTFVALTLFRIFECVWCIKMGPLKNPNDLHKKMVENSAAKQNCYRHFVRYEKNDICICVDWMRNVRQQHLILMKCNSANVMGHANAAEKTKTINKFAEAAKENGKSIAKHYFAYRIIYIICTNVYARRQNPNRSANDLHFAHNFNIQICIIAWQIKWKHKYEP